MLGSDSKPTDAPKRFRHSAQEIQVEGHDIRPDRNIPDPVEQEKIKRAAVSIAEGVADQRSSRDDLIWIESYGPGSLRWYWGRAVRFAPKIAGIFGLVIAFATPIGWILGQEFLTGSYLGAPPITIAGAAILGLISTAMLLLSSSPDRTRMQAAGKYLALTGFVVCLAVLLMKLTDSLIGWGTGAWESPDISAMFVLGTVSLAMFLVDFDPGRYRWQDRFIRGIGALLLLAIFTRGFQGTTLISGIEPAFSYSGALAAVFLYLGYVCLRPDREIPAFLVASGPGPSLARLLVPVGVSIPIFLAAMGILARNFGWSPEDLRGIDGLIVVVVLIGVIIYASRRLQRYYESWIEASAELYSQASVLSGMSEGVCVASLDEMKIVLTNPQFDLMHGWGRGELIGERLDVLAPGDLSREELDHRSGVGAELASKGSSAYENRSVRKDGSSIWCRANAIVSHDPSHGPVIILVKNDITSEHHAREERRRAELKFQQVFEQSPIGLCLVRPDGSFERVNRSFEKISGYSGAELSRITFAQITHPEDLEKDLELTEAMFAGKTDGFTMEKRYIRKDGQVVWIHLTVVMMKGKDGGPDQALSMIEDVTERRQMGLQLRYMADHDPLTGLFNRRRFEEELERIDALSEEHTTAILAIDLDNFKFINDSYGHAVGDEMIVRVAEMLRTQLRSQDVLARHGGDEFVVILNDIGADDAMAKAEELAGAIADQVRVVGPDFSARVTASIGVAIGNGTGSGRANLTMQADIAMYEAKDAGRNRARLFSPEQETHVSRGVDWAGRIQEALDKDAIELFAQPIVDLSGNGLPHFELFIRLRDADGKIVAPGAFLPVAERYDLVQEIDRWVIRKATRTLAELQADGLELKLTVNLSGRTVGDPKLSSFLQEQLEATGVNPSSLIFEVTETSAIGNITRAQEFAARLSEFGCGFALDDFGTGFASFYYLKHIGSDYVKIDGEFIRHLATDPVNQLLVRALVQIAKGMGKLTVAEQVEDQQALNLLFDYGVDYAQGFLLGIPKPIAEVDFSSIPDLGPLLRSGRGL